MPRIGVSAVDYSRFEAHHMTLMARADTTVTFSTFVRAVRVTNWSVMRVLVSSVAIASSASTSAARVGQRAAANVPLTAWFPYQTLAIHVFSTGSAEVTVEGYA